MTQIIHHYPALIADIGGTNARFAIETAPQKFEAILVLRCTEYATISDAIRAYLWHPLAVESGAAHVKCAGIAIANPVVGDVVKMTNHHWSFSISSVQNEFEFDAFLVVNDFKALAMALPQLNDTQKYQVGPGAPVAGSTLGLIGAGTGLGVSGLIPVPGKDQWVALDSEGGHTTFSPSNAKEIDILNFAMQKYSHVSSERLISGPGIELIYQALASRNSVQIEAIDTPEITRRGLNNECDLCVETLNTFCELLGSMAGNLAVTLGATGGVYIGGGIVPRLGKFFDQSHFRERFIQKGRLASFLDQIPTYVITEAYPAFIGIAALIEQRQKQLSAELR